jgi:predicted metal-binding membrane protein
MRAIPARPLASVARSAATMAAAPSTPSTSPSTRGPELAWVLIGAGWLAVVATLATGTAGLLHHHALIEDGPPMWLAIPLFLVGWLVMLAAMMLPASLPAIRLAGSDVRVEAPFIASFGVPWAIFGLFAFGGDAILHHVVDATPWLEARPWLIEGSVLLLAGVYQWTPLKRRSLELCRHPMTLLVSHVGPEASPATTRLGLEHGLTCLGSSWALMLLTFAEGFASLGWMAALTALMVYEATGRHGLRASQVAGLALVVVAVVTLAGL